MLLLVTQHTTEPCVSPYIPQQTDSHMEGSITGPRDIHHQTESHMLWCLCVSPSLRLDPCVTGGATQEMETISGDLEHRANITVYYVQGFFDLTLIL